MPKLNLTEQEINNRKKFDMSRFYRLKILQFQYDNDAAEELNRLLTHTECFSIIEPSKPKVLNGNASSWNSAVKWTDGIVEVREGKCIRAFLDRIFSGGNIFRIQPVKINF